MKKIGLYILVALVALACKQSEIHTDESLRPALPIEVPLELSFQRITAISKSEAEPHTTNDGALAGELYVGDIDQAQSKAVDESKVANVWVLQFDGTATDSKLIYKHYVEHYTAGSTVLVRRFATESRVAIVANTFDADFATGFVEGVATWATVSAATKGVASQDDVLRGADYLPMSGSTTGVVAIGGVIHVALVRTVAKLTINIRSGADLAATAFDVQLCNVPTTTSWFPDQGVGTWPTTPTVISYASQNLTGISTTSYTTLTYWVPVNRRGATVGTTGITRVTDAPLGATYLKVALGAISYTIHLGGDFLTDYNLKANTAYTYNLTLQTDVAGTDSRVNDQRTMGVLTQTPTGTIVAAGASVTVSSLNASTGLAWTAGLSNTTGFTLGTAAGFGNARSVPVTVAVNPTNVQRSSTLTATASNLPAAWLTLTQAASSLTYSSPSAATPVAADATSVTFTVTGTSGLTLSFLRTGGDAAFSPPAVHTCNGLEQTVMVTMAANTGAARQATFSATVTNAGAAGLDLQGILVKQHIYSRGVGYITTDSDGTGLPAGMMCVGMFGGHNGTNYTKALYIDKRGSETSGVNLGSTNDPRSYRWGYDGVLAGGTNDYDGLANTNLLTSSTAANYCRLKGMYLPSVAQFRDGIYPFIISTPALDTNYTFITNRNTVYWSSTEEDLTQAWYVNIGILTVSYNPKTDIRCVRCVQEF